MEEILDKINEILKLDIDQNKDVTIEKSEIIYKTLRNEYGWEKLQKALLMILADKNRTYDECYILATVFWEAIFDDLDIDKMTVIALINYRLNHWDESYEDNLAWSITSKLLKLDYANSTYNAFKDEKVNEILKSIGLIN